MDDFTAEKDTDNKEKDKNKDGNDWESDAVMGKNATTPR